MKKVLLSVFSMLCVHLAFTQTVYYWVGGLAASTGINTGSNWNTALDGSGTGRPSSSGAGDILIFNGTNLGGATPATGAAIIPATAGITCAQIKIINNANLQMRRPSSGTSTIIIAGDAGEDFVVESGSQITFNSTAGSMRFTFQATADSARVSGALSVITGQQFRFENGASGTTIFRFTSGASFTSNVTSSTSSYPFGSSSQSSSKWVAFENGSNLYYEGGYSPNGSNSTYEPIYFAPASTWHHRAANGGGSFFNKKNFGNIRVENNSTLTFDGPTYRINNLEIDAGSTVVAYTSGVTSIQGNLVANGSFTTDNASTNIVNFAGSAQTISGSTSITFAGFIASETSQLTLARDVNVLADADVFGSMNFTTKQIISPLTFTAHGPATAQTGTGDFEAGSYVINNPAGTFTGIPGQTITGNGIAPNTVVVNFSVADNAIYLSKPTVAAGTGAALSISTNGATLQTANANGFNAANGSVANAAVASYQGNISYVIDAATTTPFGISTGSTASSVSAKNVTANAAFTVNYGVRLSGLLTLNAKMSLRPADTLHMLAGASFAAGFSNTKYVVTNYVQATGVQSFVLADGITTGVTLPVGTATNYLPVTLSAATANDILVAVFTGITRNGQVNGVQLLGSQKQLVVDAIWNIQRINGNGNVGVKINWPFVLEGSTFSTLPNSDIGLIRSNGNGYNVPTGYGDNVANTATDTLAIPGNFSAGAIPQQDPFVFNPIPPKTYGAPDFNPGATSQNTTQPIMYTSSNTNVATIAGGNIHIVGAGTSIITATQATDGFYPDAMVTQTLTVNKAPLLIKADTLRRFELLPNPPLTVTYTGFVLGEGPSALSTPVTISTTAVQSSAPGVYPVTVAGATSSNYAITFINATLTVIPKQQQVITFTAPAIKTYGNADFTLSATSTNTTTPIALTSSNTAVATIAGNTVHITGAGTTTITATQPASDGFFAATPVVQTLTVNKKALIIRVSDTTKTQGQPNPTFTLVYSGFVLGDTASNLTAQPAVSTSATTSSLPGVYTLSVGGSASNNYSISYINGKLTILPAGGTGNDYLNAYGNADGNMNVTVFSTDVRLANIYIYDMSGRPVANKNILANKGFTTSIVDTRRLPSGMYIVRVVGTGINLSQLTRLIK